MNRTLAIALWLSWLAPSIALAAPSERESSGLIYVKSGATGALRDKPAADGPIVGRVPASIRVVFRRTFGEGDKTSWYYVEPPGMHAGWIAAGETSPTRPPQDLPKTKPVGGAKFDVGLRTGTVMTAAARGLDSRAGSATQQDEKASLQQFASFEKHVNDHFQDPENAEGVYPTTTTGRRKAMAAQFHEGGAK